MGEHLSSGHQHPDLGSRFHLIAGDVGDLNEIQRVLDGLSDTDYGQVFIESASCQQQRTLRAPDNLGLTWLHRDLRRSPGGFGAIAARGEVLVRAVDAWLDEWMRASTMTIDSFVIWLGCRSSSIANSYYAQLRRELDERAKQEELHR